MKPLHCSILAGLLFTAGGAWAQGAGDVANGKRVYLAKNCFTCHGSSGQGGAMNGPAPVLAQTQLPLDTFRTVVRVGPNDMPAYAESQLSDKDLADVHAFLRALPGRRPVKDFPLLNN